MAALEASLKDVARRQQTTDTNLADLATSLNSHVAASTAKYDKLFEMLDERLPPSAGRAAKATRH